MNFIEAVIAISKRKDLEFCDDERELTGEHPSICIYFKDGDISNRFIGKLRWPNLDYNLKDKNTAKADPELIEELEHAKT